ncbi:MAG: hypothetical protein RLY86_325 [Pseudomonadota bacterium]|jgi:hypothetical protein
MALEREAEMVAKLDLILELHRRMERDVHDLRGDMRGLQTGMASLAERVGRLEGRIEEQSKMLQLALAARQPRTGAA